MAMDEREFYDEREQTKPATLYCAKCRKSAEYSLAWLVRTKKPDPGGNSINPNGGRGGGGSPTRTLGAGI